MTDNDILEPELAALGAEVKAFAPMMDEEFQRELDALLAEGFPGDPKRSWFGAIKLPAPRRLVPAMAVAATLLVAVGVIGIASRGGESESEFLTQSGEVETARSGGAATPAPAPQVDLPSKSADEALSGPRKVERAANLELTTSTDDVKNVANGIVRETQAAGGYVVDSSVSTATTEANASFTLRIPSKNLDAAIASLSKLANVGSLSQDSSDITSSYVSAGDRLADTRSERKALLKALARASGAREISSLKQRLAINRQEIGSAKADVRKLQRRADLSSVQVDVAGSGERKDAAAGWTPKDAARDAVTILGAIAGGIIIALAIAIPAAVVGGLAWLAIGALQRRRRNSALSSA
jgi:hypothetical protein